MNEIVQILWNILNKIINQGAFGISYLIDISNDYWLIMSEKCIKQPLTFSQT